ncbi:hypothetical protein A2U01_0094294, partial [Trifolium medium]|nr:hypothetical protein [Trifolium medium]
VQPPFGTIALQRTTAGYVDPDQVRS